MRPVYSGVFLTARSREMGELGVSPELKEEIPKVKRITQLM